MIESRKLLGREINIESPNIVDKWGSDLKTTLYTREKVRSAVRIGDIETLARMGFPSSLLSTMQLWDKKGPDIITSYSHPEELDTYKIIGNIRLKRLVGKQEVGLHKSIVVNPYFDTIPLHQSAIYPFKFGDMGINQNIFALPKSRNIPSTSKIPTQEIVAALDTFRNNIPDIVNTFVKSIQSDISAARKKNQKVLPLTPTELYSHVGEIVTSRLRRFCEISSVQIGTGRRDIKISSLLMKIQQGLVSEIFSDEIGDETLENFIGFPAVLASENTNAINLTRQSVQLIADNMGTKVIKDCIKPGEGLAVRADGSNRETLSKDNENNFVLKDIKGETVITDEKAIEFATTQMPLGKLEFIAMFAGGKTIHMGSEYGQRERILDALGIVGDAKEYMIHLRIGDDKEHGIDAISLNNGSSYAPLPLLYITLGSENVKNLLHRVLTQESAHQMSKADFSKFIAQSLVQEVVKKI